MAAFKLMMNSDFVGALQVSQRFRVLRILSHVDSSAYPRHCRLIVPSRERSSEWIISLGFSKSGEFSSEVFVVTRIVAGTQYRLVFPFLSGHGCTIGVLLVQFPIPWIPQLELENIGSNKGILVHHDNKSDTEQTRLRGSDHDMGPIYVAWRDLSRNGIVENSNSLVRIELNAGHVCSIRLAVTIRVRNRTGPLGPQKAVMRQCCPSKPRSQTLRYSGCPSRPRQTSAP